MNGGKIPFFEAWKIQGSKNPLRGDCGISVMSLIQVKRSTKFKGQNLMDSYPGNLVTQALLKQGPKQLVYTKGKL